jgi:epoxyqueuosine reductase QueG
MLDSILKIIERAVNSSTPTRMYSPVWRQPITRVVSALRPEFDELKQVVSKDHLLPQDILPDAKSVICFFIPFKKEIAKTNISGDKPSKKWAQAYILTNTLISTISTEIEKLMNKYGFSVGKIPATHNFDKITLLSNWSHRHVAYIAGLGTFGINNMLITELGCCGRLGSIVTNYTFDDPSTEKTEEKCLFKRDGSCGICRERCIAGAYENGGFNRVLCYKTCVHNAKYHEDMGLADVCGKCCVGLPCSLVDPAMKKRD